MSSSDSAIAWLRTSAIGFGSDKQSSEFRQDARGANILIGKAIKGGFNQNLIAPWGEAAFAAFLGYGLATIFGKSLEHS